MTGTSCTTFDDVPIPDVNHLSGTYTCTCTPTGTISAKWDFGSGS